MRKSLCFVAATLAVMMLPLAGCSDEPAPPAAPAEPVHPLPVGEMQRFASPPGSRSMGAMDEPAARLSLPLGGADPAGEVPVRHVEGRVFRRVSMAAGTTDFQALLEYYRQAVTEGGYEVLFECVGMDACGGDRFVGTVIEDYVTAPANVSRSSTVITLTRPAGGELGHFSLMRQHPGVTEFVGITVARSENGPPTVVTQQAFVASTD